MRGCRICNHGDAVNAGARESDRLSRDPRSHLAPRSAWTEALISGFLLKRWPISHHGYAMTVCTEIPTGFLAILGGIPPLACQGEGR